MCTNISTSLPESQINEYLWTHPDTCQYLELMWVQETELSTINFDPSLPSWHANRPIRQHTVSELSLPLSSSQIIADKSFLGSFENRDIFKHRQSPWRCAANLPYLQALPPLFSEKQQGRFCFWVLSQENSLIRECPCLETEVLATFISPVCWWSVASTWMLTQHFLTLSTDINFNKIMRGHEIV